MNQKIYVGVSKGTREVFRSAIAPTERSHGARYAAVIGPFRTVRAARLMAETGGSNPHLLSVGDAERIARIVGQ